MRGLSVARFAKDDVGGTGKSWSVWSCDAVCWYEAAEAEIVASFAVVGRSEGELGEGWKRVG